MVKTYANFGYEGQLVDVEIDLRSGIPAVDIVGLADDSVSASRETIKKAVKAQGFKFPDECVLITMSPSDMEKDDGCSEKTALEIVLENKGRSEAAALLASTSEGCLAAAALAVVLANEGYSADTDILVVGRLDEQGRLGYCPGIWAACEAAKAQGIKYAVLPDCTEACLVEGMEAVLVKNLHEAYIAVEAFSFSKAKAEGFDVRFSELDEDDDSLDDVHGYGALKEAMLVAACGGHHMLTVCRHDSVETWLMQHFDLLLPLLDRSEREEVYRIHSIAGTLNSIVPVSRPFVSPHPTVGIEGMCGGGRNCRPGAISMAHRGALFLRGAQEFRSSVLQMLRVPLESNSIIQSRAGRSTMYPARFQLLMTAQSCPCGNFGTEKPCLCSVKDIVRYWQRIGNPLLDRVPIRITESGEEDDYINLKGMRETVKRTWERQLSRQGFLNEYIGRDVTEKIVNRYSASFPNGLSVRAMHETAKVARTLADMEGRESVEEKDVLKALCLRGKLHFEMIENA